MKTIETINTLCQKDASLYRAHRDELLNNIKTLDECVSEARDNNESVRNAAKAFISKVGAFAAKVTVASLVNRSAWDGRISTANANWAKAIDEAWDEDAMVRMGAYCKMHMAHLDQTADYVRRNLDEIAAEIEAERKAKQEAKAEQTEATIPESELDEAVCEDVQKELDAERREEELRHLFDAAREVTWDRYEHAKLESAGIYDYHQAVLDDVIEVIWQEEPWKECNDRDELEDALNDDLFTRDCVTGNGSGSYTFSRAKAEECVRGNNNLIREMVDEFGIDRAEMADRFMDGDWEWFDVSIRCYLLGWAIHYALDLLQDGLFYEEVA